MASDRYIDLALGSLDLVIMLGAKAKEVRDEIAEARAEGGVSDERIDQMIGDFTDLSSTVRAKLRGDRAGQ